MQAFFHLLALTAPLFLLGYALSRWGRWPRALALPPLELVTVVVMASLPVGANVYLMAREFKAMEGPVASSLVLTTALAAVTTPLLLALLGVSPP